MNIGQSIIMLFTIFIMAVTLSADNFSVGVAYGLFKIRLTLKSLMIMVLGSAVSTYGAMLIGRYIFTFIPEYVTAWFSAVILVFIGCKTLYNGWKCENDKFEFLKVKPFIASGVRKKNFWETYMVSFGFWETFIVGFGLGVDDFAQALGLSLAGFPIVLTVILLEVAEVITISCGNYLAFKGFSKKVNGKLSIIPGVVLILVGVWRVVS